MTPYYTVSTPANDIAATATDLRRNEYHLYKENLPDLNADIVLAANELACLTGRSDQFTQTIFSAFYRLLDLPKLTALQERLYHLDLFRLCAIDAVISKLNNPDDDTLNRIDEALTSYLTPTRQGQSLPSVAHIRRKLNTLVSAEDPEIKRKRKVRRPTYSSYPLPAGQGGITGEYDLDTVAELDTVIRETATEHDVSPAEALRRLIMGEAHNTTRVTLNVYRATDLPNAPVYIQGFGWADSETGQKLSSRATTTRSMESAAGAESTSYVTPEGIKAFINGRDGTCRWPGCSQPTHQCQKDHCVDFADGGPTASWNLVNLCQHHHNVKTDGRATYIFDPATDDVVWLFEDGTWRATQPEGPLTKKTGIGCKQSSNFYKLAARAFAKKL